jgi:hypothetical protein
VRAVYTELWAAAALPGAATFCKLLPRLVLTLLALVLVRVLLLQILLLRSGWS